MNRKLSAGDMERLSADMQDLLLAEDDLIEVEVQSRGDRRVLYVHVNGVTVSRFNVLGPMSFTLNPM